jgi:AcrR family transcriptional regulator
LDAAERAFTTHGVENTRVEDVAAEADVATGLLYRYFSSKEDLLDALMQRRADAFHERMRGRLEQLDTQQQPPAVLVAEGLRVWLEQVIADVAAGRWVTRTEAAPCARFRQQTREFVITRINAAVPGVDPAVASIVTAMLEAVAESAAEAWNQAGQPLDGDAVTELVSGFCLGGLERLAQVLGLDMTFEVQAQAT